MKPAYAIIRHEKIKGGRHLVTCGLHNVRGMPTPNADPDAPDPVVVLHGTSKPWKDVQRNLKAMGIEKVRKNGNVAFEVVLATSPEFWTDRGWEPGVKPSPQVQAVLDAWVAENMAYARERFGNLLVSSILHLDERSPHIHLLVIPAQHRVDRREKGEGAGKKAWRLSAEQMIRGPSHLKTIVSEYAAQMERFGLVRGETRETGTVQHKPVKVWQNEQAEQAVQMGRAIAEQREVKIEAERTADELIAAAKMKAARIVADAERQAREHAELEVTAEAERRRKDDASRALERRVLAQAAELKAERREVVRLKARLEGIVAQAEKLLAPILSMAEAWKKASPLRQAAMGRQGEKAAMIADAAEVSAIMALAAQRQGAGR